MATERVRERLAALRDQFHISEAGIARTTGFRQQKVNDFFNGQMKFPALDFMDAIARVFHYTLADLLAKDLPPSTLTSTERAILSNLKQMETAQRVAFENLILKPKAGSGRRRGSN